MRIPAVVLALIFFLVASVVDFGGYVIVNIVFIILAAFSLVAAFAPSFSLSHQKGDIAPAFDEYGMERAKIAKLIEFTQQAKDRIYMLVGEFHPSVFNSRALARALREAVKRGVKVRLIIGDRARSHEALRGHISETNSAFLDELKPAIDSRAFRIYFGPRQEKHFYIFDRIEMIEGVHPPDKASAWHFMTNTWLIADKDAVEFLELARGMQLLF